MFKNLFQSSDFMTLPQITLIAFIAIFIGVWIWTFSKRRKPHYDRMAQMPLDDRMPKQDSPLDGREAGQ